MKEIRFTEVTDEVVQVFFNVIEKYFPSYQNLSIKLIFDTKKRISKGKLTLASIEIPGVKTKYFQITNDLPTGYDYILILDQLAWETATSEEKENIMRHELSHIYIDIDDDSNKIVGHDYNVFEFEVDLGIGWATDLVQSVASKYEAMKG